MSEKMYIWSGIDQFSLLRLHHYFVVLIQLLDFLEGEQQQSLNRIKGNLHFIYYISRYFLIYIRKKSLLDKAPNQVVECVIQKRVVLYFVSDSITSSIKMSHKCTTTNSNCFAAAVTNHAHSLMTKQKSILVVSINCSSMHIQLSFPMKRLIIIWGLFYAHFQTDFQILGWSLT